MNWILRWAFVFCGVLLVTGCSTTQVSLDYQGQAMATEGPGNVEMGVVKDNRNHGSHWLGAIRGGMGNPLKTLETAEPVADVVSQNFQAGLASRGLLSAEPESADYRLDVDMIQLDSNQMVRREAHARFRVALLRVDDGREVYSRSVRADKVESGGGIGVLGSVDELRDLVERVLSEAIADALDDERLFQVVAAGPARSADTDVESRLEVLRQLRDEGVLSDEEYREHALRLISQ